MVIVPSGELGDFLLTYGAKTFLLPPEANKLASTPQVIGHFHPQALLKVDFPGGVIGIGRTADLDMSLDRHLGGTR